MKYIDAEKLKKFLTERYEVCPINDDERHGRHCAIIEIQNFIDSLQQEQHLPRWIHANYSDKPEVRYTPSGVPYLQNGAHMIWLSDLEMLPKDGTDLINTIQAQPEEICSKCIYRGKDDGYCYYPHGGMQSCINENGVYKCTGFCEKEQPDVDLEKEIDDWYNIMGIPVTADALKETARHFAEWGAIHLNAKKEE